LILIDFVWGAVAVYPLDWTRAADVVLGTSFLIGLPAYVFDFWRKGRIPIVNTGLELLTFTGENCSL